MGFSSRVSRVWGIGIVERLCRLKLDLEAVVEDANEEVYSFQIQRSLIYLKFVGGCRGSDTIIDYLRMILSVHRLFIAILLKEGLFSEILSYSTVFEYQQRSFHCHLQQRLHTLVNER